MDMIDQLEGKKSRKEKEETLKQQHNNKMVQELITEA